MSVTRSKQGHEEMEVNCYNVSKTITKQLLEGDMEHQKPAGRWHAENHQNVCDFPPPPGEYWGILNPPMLSTDKKATSITTKMLYKENQQKRHSRQ